MQPVGFVRAPGVPAVIPPHPGPLPPGEGVTGSALAHAGRTAPTCDGLTFSLSQRERAGVREGVVRWKTAHFISTASGGLRLLVAPLRQSVGLRTWQRNGEPSLAGPMAKSRGFIRSRISSGWGGQSHRGIISKLRPISERLAIGPRRDGWPGCVPGCCRNRSREWPRRRPARQGVRGPFRPGVACR